MGSTGHDIATRHRNWLLRALPPEEQELLTPHLEYVPLELGRVICEVNVPVEHVYFPEQGIISSLSVMADGSAVETATIGPEGMSGIVVFHGVDAAPEHVFVQVAGEAYRMASGPFRNVLRSAPALTSLLHRYSAALLTLIGQNSGCNRKHSVLQRCARWLLMTHDRVEGDGFELTHHILSQMLGVRRASVTEAALALHDVGAIEYRRGLVTVLDRQALERQSCECYGIIRHTFDRLLGDGQAAPNPLEGLRLSKDGRSIAKDGTPQARPGEGPDALS
ncbi:MAG: Crp/Fnr family transcriptional regulator [Gemmatimonadaceae bacterium]